MAPRVTKKAAKQVAKRSATRAAKKKVSAKKKAAPVKKPATLTMAEGWRSVFIDNEKNKKPDAALVERMEKLFPESAGKSTITRVSMMRCCYNKGSALFTSMGPAKKPSYKYVDGIKKEPNKKPTDKPAKPAKPAAKKKVAAKKKSAVKKKRSAKQKAGSK